MQIYNKYFNLPNYFAFFCRLHPTEPIGISGFYAPPYKWKFYETKLKEIEKQIDDYIYEQNMSSNREENDDREGGRQSITPISSNRQ